MGGKYLIMTPEADLVLLSVQRPTSFMRLLSLISRATSTVKNFFKLPHHKMDAAGSEQGVISSPSRLAAFKR